MMTRSQLYMLSPDVKPLVLALDERLRIGGEVEAQALQAYRYSGPDVQPPDPKAAWALGQLRGIALSARVSVSQLVAWARKPGVPNSVVDAKVLHGRDLANLDSTEAQEHYWRLIQRGLERELEVKVCAPPVEVLCEGCLSTHVVICEGGTVRCAGWSTACPFEWLPVIEDGHRVCLCLACAAHAYAITSSGFAPLFLEEFREALADLSNARCDAEETYGAEATSGAEETYGDEERNDDGEIEELSKWEASVPFYEAVMRRRRERLKSSSEPRRQP